eukprot:tig00001373_g8445.t1
MAFSEADLSMLGTELGMSSDVLRNRLSSAQTLHGLKVGELKKLIQFVRTKTGIGLSQCGVKNDLVGRLASHIGFKK